jgi:hypothetical protein
VFYEKLSCKPNAFSKNNTSILTENKFRNMWPSVVFDSIISLCFVYSKNNGMNMNKENSMVLRRFAKSRRGPAAQFYEQRINILV